MKGVGVSSTDHAMLALAVQLDKFGQAGVPKLSQQLRQDPPSTHTSGPGPGPSLTAAVTTGGHFFSRCYQKPNLHWPKEEYQRELAAWEEKEEFNIELADTKTRSRRSKPQLQTQGPRAESGLHLVLSGPAPSFYLAAAPSSHLTVKE